MESERNLVEGEQLSVQLRGSRDGEGRRGSNPAAGGKANERSYLIATGALNSFVSQIDPGKPPQSDDHSEI
jgi:hypothetical protein